MHIFCDAKNAHFRGIYEWESPRGLVNGNSLDFGKAGGLMKSPIYGYLVKSPAFPKFSSWGYTQKCRKSQILSRKKKCGYSPKNFEDSFFLSSFFRVPPQKSSVLFSPVTLFLPVSFSIFRIVTAIFACNGHF